MICGQIWFLKGCLILRKERGEIMQYYIRGVVVVVLAAENTSHRRGSITKN